MISQNLVNQLIEDEAEMLFPYEDSVGKISIGIGHNLDDNGITKEISRALFDNDIKNTYNDLLRAFPWFEKLSIIRASVMLNMCFNMGLQRFSSFKKTLNFIEYGQYEEAAIEMLDSKWAIQVGNRAVRLSEQMRSNKWQ